MEKGSKDIRNNKEETEERSKIMTCFMCKGKLEDKKTNFIADLGDMIIIIKEVPSQVCVQCGEVSYSDEVAQQINRIIENMKKQNMEIVVTRYSSALAA